MLIDVLNRIASNTGLHPTQNRNTIVTLLNAAAKEMYDRLECNKVYWEDTLSVPPNKIISLPSYIYELRGMRSNTTEMPFNLKPMGNPRYVRQDWSYRWRNWRDLGESATMQDTSVIGKLAITTSIVESTPVEVIISGQTNEALRIEEKVTMNTLTKQTTNLFGPTIHNIACVSAERTSDITISDSNGVLLAVLYNIDKQTRYKMIDVSEAPWSLDTTEGNSLIDVLFKVPLYYLSKDSDNFPASVNFDNAWYWMAMWLYYKPMQNKPEDFNSFFPSALAAMKSAKDSGESHLDKRLTFGRNKFYDLTRGRRCYPGACTHIDNAN